MAQPWLPDWYPDPGEAAVLRWWDGVEWTEDRKPAEETESQPLVAATGRPRRDSKDESAPISTGNRLVAAMLFFATALLAGFEAVYMTGLYGPRSLIDPSGVPVALPFDWFVVLFPYIATGRAFFTWSLVPPVILLAACALAAIVAGKRRPRVVVLLIASLLTIENMLLLIPLFIDVGMPGFPAQPIFSPSNFADYDDMTIPITVIILHVVVWALPLLLAGTTIGSAKTRRRLSRVFLAAVGAYFAVYLGFFLPFNDPVGHYLISPGPSEATGSWLAPLTTGMCLVGMILFVPRSRSDRQSAVAAGGDGFIVGDHDDGAVGETGEDLVD